MGENDVIFPGDWGSCCICGEHRKLTFEHIPPKSAFNTGGGRSATMRQLLAEEQGRNVRYSKNRKGFGRVSLCAPCNNNTGRWYGRAYTDWAYQGMRFINATGSLALPFHVFPGRIAKQILAMFASTNRHYFFEAHPGLRKYVLDPHSIGIPENLRLYVYLTTSNNYVSRTTGVVAAIYFGRDPRTSVFSEIAFMPFGYILSIDSPPPAPNLFDITFFCQHRYNDYRDLHLPISSREVHSHFPADFRTKEEWEAAKNKAEAERLVAAVNGDSISREI